MVSQKDLGLVDVLVRLAEDYARCDRDVSLTFAEVPPPEDALQPLRKHPFIKAVEWLGLQTGLLPRTFRDYLWWLVHDRSFSAIPCDPQAHPEMVHEVKIHYGPDGTILEGQIDPKKVARVEKVYRIDADCRRIVPEKLMALDGLRAKERLLAHIRANYPARQIDSILSGSAQPQKHGRGAPPQYSTKTDREIYDDWQTVKGKGGMSREEFAKQKRMALVNLKQLLDREGGRRRQKRTSAQGCQEGSFIR